MRKLEKELAPTADVNQAYFLVDEERLQCALAIYAKNAMRLGGKVAIFTCEKAEADDIGDLLYGLFGIGGRRYRIGSYQEMLKFYLTHRNFRAYRHVMLYKPLSGLIALKSKAGFFDGLLGRLLGREGCGLVCVFDLLNVADERLVRKWVEAGMVTSEASNPVNLTDRLRALENEWIFQSILTVLYYSHRSWSRLVKALRRTIWWNIAPLTESEKRCEGALRRLLTLNLVKKSGGKYFVSEIGQKIVETLTRIGKYKATRKLEPKVFKPEFHLRRSTFVPKGTVRDFLRDSFHECLNEQGWLTLKGLKAKVDYEITKEAEYLGWKLAQIGEEPEEEEELEPQEIPVKTVHRLLEKLVDAGELKKTFYRKGIGRPQAVYYRDESELPELFSHQCRKCAFYRKQRGDCRLWHPIRRRFGWWNPRWIATEYGGTGEMVLSTIEMDKLKWAWRIDPNSTACEQFVRQKKEAAKLMLEKTTGPSGEIYLCDICKSPLLVKLSTTPIKCANCLTAYKIMSDGLIHFLPSYEHEFRKRYEGLTDESPPAIKPRAPKKVYLVIWPGDKLSIVDGKIVVKRGKRSIRYESEEISSIADCGGLDFETHARLLQLGVCVVGPFEPSERELLSKVPDFELHRKVEEARKSGFEIARVIAKSTALSTIVATKRIGRLNDVPDYVVKKALSVQLAAFDRLMKAPIGRLMVYEAQIAAQYWKVFKWIAQGAGFKIRSRVKERFVREFVSPSRRGSGYTPINAAINFLHQYRLLKCRAVNARVGLGWDSGEGLLHNAEQKGKWKIGLLLDLADPFKLADREVLLQICLERRLTWRDFRWTLGRQGLRFYYPKRETTKKLVHVSTIADTVRVYCDRNELPLMNAYKSFVKGFIKAFKAEDVEQFMPFIYATKEEYEWVRELI